MTQSLTQPNRIALIAALWLMPGAAFAQWGVRPADSLLAEGRLSAAESMYYRASRTKPRDPIARAALGRFLAARGGVKAGAVLLEEAQFFGGDSATLARQLVPLYMRLRDFRSLAELRPNVLSAAERRRAAWLVNRPSLALMRDTAVTLNYQPLRDGRGFGTVVLRIGGTELPALIDPRVSGLVVPSSLRRAIRTFGTDGGRTIGVADTVRIGAVAFTHVPTIVGGPNEAVRIGFDVIGPYNPSFDPGHNTLQLRRVDRRARSPMGARVPALFDDSDVRLLIGNRWQATTTETAASLLATRRWLWDWKLGDVVLLP